MAQVPMKYASTRADNSCVPGIHGGVLQVLEQHTNWLLNFSEQIMTQDTAWSDYVSVPCVVFTCGA
jgi:hypothetical protein